MATKKNVFHLLSSLLAHCYETGRCVCVRVNVVVNDDPLDTNNIFVTHNESKIVDFYGNEVVLMGTK